MILYNKDIILGAGKSLIVNPGDIVTHCVISRKVYDPAPLVYIKGGPFTLTNCIIVGDTDTSFFKLPLRIRINRFVKNFYIFKGFDVV